jgi:hypothetical protein
MGYFSEGILMARMMLFFILSIQLLIPRSVYSGDNTLSSNLISYMYSDLLKAKLSSDVKKFESIQSWDDIDRLLAEITNEKERSFLNSKLSRFRHVRYQAPNVNQKGFVLELKAGSEVVSIDYLNEKIQFQGREFIVKDKSLEEFVLWLIPDNKFSIYNMLFPEAMAEPLSIATVFTVGVLIAATIKIAHGFPSMACRDQEKLRFIKDRTLDLQEKCQKSLESEIISYDIQNSIRAINDNRFYHFLISSSARQGMTCIELLHRLAPDTRACNELKANQVSTQALCKMIDDLTVCLKQLHQKQALINSERESGKEVGRDQPEKTDNNASGAIGN